MKTTENLKILWIYCLMTKGDFVGGYCTLDFHKSLLKIRSLQVEFPWRFTCKILHNAFRSVGICYILVSCLACNLIAL